MNEKLIQRLESAVARLEALSVAGYRPSVEIGEDAAGSSDPAIIAFDDLMSQFVGKVTSAAEKIGGQVFDVTKILAEAFAVQKELLIKIKQTRVNLR